MQQNSFKSCFLACYFYVDQCIYFMSERAVEKHKIKLIINIAIRKLILWYTL